MIRYTCWLVDCLQKKQDQITLQQCFTLKLYVRNKITCSCLQSSLLTGNFVFFSFLTDSHNFQCINRYFNRYFNSTFLWRGEKCSKSICLIKMLKSTRYYHSEISVSLQWSCKQCPRNNKLGFIILQKQTREK